MNCHFIQNQISAFIDQELNPDEKQILRHHILTCPECHDHYQEILQLKNYLENINQVELANFDFCASLKLRVSAEESSIITRTMHKWYWFNRLGLIAACVSVFFVTTVILFPTEERNDRNFAASDSGLSVSPVSCDQNLSLDQSVTVYQAASIFP